MIIRYGAYAFPIGTVKYKDRIENAFNDQMQRTVTTRRVTIDGSVQGNAKALAAEIAAMERAFSIDGKDFSVTSPDGVPCCLVRSKDTVYGLRVTFIEYPIGEGIEWVGRRTFQMEIVGEIQVTEGIDDVSGGGGGEYSQTVSYEGTGGPRKMVIECMNSAPVVQIVNSYTKCRCTQQGRSVNKAGGGRAPGPLYPDKEMVDLRSISFTEATGEVTWNYVFESPSSF